MLSKTTIQKECRYADFSDRFNEALAHAGINHESLAALGTRFDISRQHIQRLRKGTSACSNELGQAISEVTGVTFEWLMTGRGDMYRELFAGKISVSHLSHKNQKMVMELVKALEN